MLIFLGGFLFYVYLYLIDSFYDLFLVPGGYFKLLKLSNIFMIPFLIFEGPLCEQSLQLIALTQSQILFFLFDIFHLFYPAFCLNEDLAFNVKPTFYRAYIGQYLHNSCCIQQKICHFFYYSIIFYIYPIGFDYLLLFENSFSVMKVSKYNQYVFCILGYAKNNSAKSSSFSMKMDWINLLQMRICFWLPSVLENKLVFMTYWQYQICEEGDLCPLKDMILVEGAEFFLAKIPIHIFYLPFLFYYSFYIQYVFQCFISNIQKLISHQQFH